MVLNYECDLLRHLLNKSGKSVKQLKIEHRCVRDEQMSVIFDESLVEWAKENDKENDKSNSNEIVI